MGNIQQNRLLSVDFNHYIPFYDQNEYDIRNQHEKLSRKLYFSMQIFFSQNHMLK